MHKIVIHKSHPVLDALKLQDSIEAYYSSDTKDVFVICESILIKQICMSLGIISSLVSIITKEYTDFRNVFVVAGPIYSSEQFTKLSIAQYKKKT